ncbi:uncharacterized protein LOC133632179 [Entelurus aequoreus]|uniref:uncharacterized protein LOC133632179 n=1 Tax=Entelurus aequoreus TaxID=161455 RepID=UPI002B1DF37A|nr:uncharacterized protein LOC133632179 [Entelurus aequoreus]
MAVAPFHEYRIAGKTTEEGASEKTRRGRETQDNNIKMLKVLIKERLMAAADEIFALFERTMASYEEEHSPTRKEKEQQRQQLDAVFTTQSVLQIKDGQQMIARQEQRPPLPQEGSSTLEQVRPQPPHINQEDLWVIGEEERLLGPKEADLTMLPLTVVSVKIEEYEDQSQADNLLAPLTDHNETSYSTDEKDINNTQEPLSSDTDCEDVHQMIGRHDRPPQPQGGGFTLEQEDQEPAHFKEEEEALWISHDGSHCGRSYDGTKLPQSAAEKQRRYRARRDADPERRERYLKREKEKYKTDVESGRRKRINEVGNKEKHKRRQKWRETYHRMKGRKEAVRHLITAPGYHQCKLQNHNQALPGNINSDGQMYWNFPGNDGDMRKMEMLTTQTRGSGTTQFHIV